MIVYNSILNIRKGNSIGGTRVREHRVVIDNDNYIPIDGM